MAAIAALVVVTGVRLGVAARWDLLADEAYHWTWALKPAFGYYDQPPLVAWVLALARSVFGDHAFALRLTAVVGWTGAVVALAPAARSRGPWLWWALGLPPLAVLTVLAVPDGLLLPLWGLGLAAAFRGGRGWWWAGVFGGLASLAKYSGMALLPLLILGATPAERRSRDPWIGLFVGGVLLAPNLWWNANHDWVTFRFQLSEGLLSPLAPGLPGILRQGVDQALVAGPVAALAGAAWMSRATWRWRTLDRIDRMCLATSAPLALGFAAAAAGGPPEAHWPAPAWIAVGLGLARSGGRLARLGYLGAVLGAFGTVALGVHAERPLVKLPEDPGIRLTEGRLMAGGIARWVVPPGRAPLQVYTERYQEASLIRWHTGLPARTLPGCGRRSQFDLLDEAFLPAPQAWFVRPSRGGPPTCLDRWFDADAIREPHPVSPIDDHGRRVGRWDLFELGPR